MKAYNIEFQVGRQSDGLWRAEVPGLDGCFADGPRLSEVLAGIQEVASMFIELYREEGRALPPSVSVAVDGPVSAKLPLLVEEHPSKRSPRAQTKVSA